MPTTTIYTKLAAGQTAFTTAEQVGEYVVSYPLGSAEPTAILVRAPFEVFRPSYSRPAANSAFTYSGQTVYFANDENFSDRGASLMRFDRVWVSVPASWNEPLAYPYSYPAVAASGIGTSYSISAITASGSNYVLSTSATGISAGDLVYVQVSYTRSSLKYTTSFFSTAVAATSSISVTVSGLMPGSGVFASVSGTVRKGYQGRSVQRVITSAGRVLRDYALSSQSALATDLPLFQPFGPTDSSGNIVTSLTSSTVPSASAYGTLVASGGELVVECTYARYFNSNVYERATTLVPAL